MSQRVFLDSQSLIKKEVMVKLKEDIVIRSNSMTRCKVLECLRDMKNMI
jgi:hypothetical protein